MTSENNFVAKSSGIRLMSMDPSLSILSQQICIDIEWVQVSRTDELHLTVLKEILDGLLKLGVFFMRNCAKWEK